MTTTRRTFNQATLSASLFGWATISSFLGQDAQGSSQSVEWRT